MGMVGMIYQIKALVALIPNDNKKNFGVSLQFRLSKASEQIYYKTISRKT